MENILLKKALRQKLMAERKRISQESRQKMDTKITDIFLKSELYQTCEKVLIYVSTTEEVDTHGIIRQAIKDQKTVGVPLVDRETKTMSFYQIDDLNDLKEGFKGILEPVHKDRVVEIDSQTLCVVPGLSFNHSHYRIGYGGGFYDKFLSQHPILTVGLCRSTFYDSDEIPVDLHDQKIDSVITDKGFV